MQQCHLSPLVAQAQNSNIICSMTPKHLDTFGKRVRLLRHGIGMNQQDLVQALERYGVSIGRSYVSELERTDKTPTGDVVAAMARVLGTTADYLLMVTDEDAPAEAAQAFEAISEEAEEVAQLVDGMTPERRQDTLAIVRALYQRDNASTVLLKRYDVLMNRIRERDGDDGVIRAEDLLRRFLDSLPGSSSVA